MLWIDWRDRPSLYTDLIEIADDGTGNPRRLRAPSPVFDTALCIVGDKMRYRLRNSVRIGDEVRFAYPIESVNTGVALSADNNNVIIQVTLRIGLMERIIEAHRYQNEVVRLADEIIMKAWGKEYD